MERIYETLLYIAFNLYNQNQVLTLETMKQPLEWIQSKEGNVEEDLSWLVRYGFLTKKLDEYFFTDTGKKEASRINKIRAKEDFSNLISRCKDSVSYLDYCEEIYGYRMSLFNMTDRQQLDFLFEEVPITKCDTILDLGCGTACILNNLISKHQCYGIGTDHLDSDLVESNKLLTYIEEDIDSLSDSNLTPTITLAVDSLYFSKDLIALIKFLKNIKDNRLYLFYSQYIFDETSTHRSVLHRDNTRIAGAIQKNNLQYQVIDYSANEHRLYEHALQILPKYKHAFEREGNGKIYETKLKENRSGKELYDKGLASRYLYIVTC